MAAGMLRENSASGVVERVEALWSGASLRTDVDSLLSLYTTDAMFFGSLPRLFIGHQGIREYFNSVPLSAARGIAFFDRQVRLLDDAIIASSSYVNFDLALANGPARWRFGISWTLIRQQGDWKIASHHASPRETSS